MGRCHRCGHKHYQCTCLSGCNDCDCPKQIKGKCVFYQGANLDCLDVTKGDDYDSILVALNDIICDILPPTGLSTIVNSCSNGIVVTSNTVEDVTTYTVCLNSDITDQVDENTNDILAIEACLSDTVADLVSDSIEITEESSDSCGRTLRLKVITPSGIPTYDGIIYNDLDKSGTTGSGGVQILKSFNNNYVSSSNISVGDEIRYQIIGQIDPSTLGADSITVELFNSNTATIIDSTSYSAFNPDSNVLSSFIFKGEIALQSATSGRHTLEFVANEVMNNSFGNASTALKAYDIDVMDFTGLTIRIKFDNTSLSSSGNNYVHKLMVEVRKKI